MVQFINEFLAHRLTQGVALAAGEVGNLAGEEHDLLLIDGDAVGVLQVLLHAGEIVLDGLLAVLTLDELRDVGDRAGTIEGVHGDEVLEGGGLEFAQVFLHAWRFKLEGANGVAIAIELVGGGVFDADFVDIDLNAERLADVGDGLADDGERLEAEEVHLDETRLLNHLALVLGAVEFLARLLVVGSRYGHPVRNVVAADDETAGVDTRIADVALEHLGIAERVAHHGVAAGFGLAQLGDGGNGIGKVHLGNLAVGTFGQFVGDEFAKAVADIKRQLLHTGHVLQRRLGGHGAVGDDVGHLLLAIFLRDPVEHAAAAIVIEINVDIGQGDTVGIQETLEQEVVLDGVHLGDTQAIGHGTTGGRTTARTNGNVQFLASGTDVVLHDEEVAWETHRLHNVQLKLDALGRFFVQGISVATLRTFVGQFGKVVGFELDAVEFVVAAQLLDFFLALLARHHDIAVLVLRKFVVEVLLREARPVFLFRAEIFGNLEVGHNRGVVDGVGLALVANLQRIAERFGNVGKDGVHLCLRLEPLLLRVEHSRGVVEVLARGQTDEAVVGLAVLLIYEMDVVAANDLNIIALRNVEKDGVDLLLHRIGFAIGAHVRVGHLVSLEFYVVVIAKDVFEPTHRFFSPLNVALHNLLRYLATQTGGADNQVFVKLLQIFVVRTRTHIEAVHPRARNEFDEVVVAVLVLGQHNKVPAAAVNLSFLQFLVAAARHVHLATENRLEIGNRFLLGNHSLRFGDKFLVGFPFIGILSVLIQRRRVRTLLERLQFDLRVLERALGFAANLVGIIEKLLDGHHIAVVGNGHSLHTIANGFIH